jgi:HPt (histidine-containing phosphotransfer) domain-containing protein
MLRLLRMPGLPVLDPVVIESLRELNPEDPEAFVREIAGIFLSDTPARIAELDASLAAGDAAKFTRAAHSIKGSSANIGAAALGAAAERLEAHAKKAGLAGVDDLLSQVRAQFAAVRIELEKLQR